MDAVKAFDWRSLGDVERVALRDAVSDIKQGDVTQFFDASEEGECSADLADAGQCNLFA